MTLKHVLWWKLKQAGLIMTLIFASFLLLQTCVSARHATAKGARRDLLSEWQGVLKANPNYRGMWTLTSQSAWADVGQAVVFEDKSGELIYWAYAPVTDELTTKASWKSEAAKFQKAVSQVEPIGSVILSPSGITFRFAYWRRADKPVYERQFRSYERHEKAGEITTLIQMLLPATKN